MARRVILLLMSLAFIFTGLHPSLADAAKSVPATVIFHRVAEPKENAFTMLVPKGWLVEGGVYRVDPSRAGGPGNSVEAKCDIAVKSDRSGTVMLRRLPKINYADGPIVPPTHGPGANYNGMTVVRMPNVEGFLGYTFKQVRPGAKDVKVVRKEPLPKLACGRGPCRGAPEPPARPGGREAHDLPCRLHGRRVHRGRGALQGTPLHGPRRRAGFHGGLVQRFHYSHARPGGRGGQLETRPRHRLQLRSVQPPVGGGRDEGPGPAGRHGAGGSWRT